MEIAGMIKHFVLGTSQENLQIHSICVKTYDTSNFNFWIACFHDFIIKILRT
jgi:hypothetical protein